jgi:tRNA threonylcarbamoyladenosine modification (KEOPS) complex Cgi121 subunit
LLKEIEEFKKWVEIAGFKRVKIKNIESLLHTAYRGKRSINAIQFLDAESVATWEHVYFAVLNALTAFKNKRNISKSLAMETMLYASTQRQIRRATEFIGIKPTSCNIVILLVGETPQVVESALAKISRLINGRRDDRVLGLSQKKVRKIKEKFGISETEFGTVAEKNGLEKALVNLLIERMALLATQL